MKLFLCDFVFRVMAPSKEVLCELMLPPKSSTINGCKLCVKTEHLPVLQLVSSSIQDILTTQ